MASYTSQNVVYGRAFLDTIIAAFGTAPMTGLIHLAKLRLSKDPAFAPNTDSTISSLSANEADFTGYTSGGYTMTFTGPVRAGPTCEAQVANVLPVRGATLPGVNNTVYGYWIDDGTNVIMAEAFGGGFTAPFANPGDYLDLTVVNPLQSLQPAA